MQTIDNQNTNHNLVTLDSKNNEQVLQYISSNKSQEMLGVYLSPDGNNEDQFQIMKQKAIQFGEVIRSQYFHRHEVWIALKTMVMKSLEYVLPATTLTKAQCDKIMWQLLQHFLPRAGINRYVKRDVLYAPVTIQDLV